MSAWVAFGFAALLLIALVLAARRATLLLEIRAEDGRVVRLQGRAPGQLLHDLADVLAQAKATGTVRLRLEDGAVAVEAPELDAATRQQLRNTVGRFPAARLKTAPRVSPHTRGG